MGFKLPSIQELKLKANIVQNDIHSDSNRTELDYTEQDDLNAKQNSLQNFHLVNSGNPQTIPMNSMNIMNNASSMSSMNNMVSMNNTNNMITMNNTNNMNNMAGMANTSNVNNMNIINGIPNVNNMSYLSNDNNPQQQVHPQNIPPQIMLQPPMYQNLPQMNSMIMPSNPQMLNYNNMVMVPQFYMNPNYMLMNNQPYYNNIQGNYIMNHNNMMQHKQQMGYIKPNMKQENKVHKPIKKNLTKPKKNVIKSSEPCIEYDIKNHNTKKDIDIIEKVKRSLLKNRQGRPITLDLSINATLYESLNDYILHYLRKNYNLDYWYSQDINLDSISYMNGGNREISEITKKLRNDIDLDNLKENDSIVINNLDILKFLYLEKSNIETKNFNYKLPFNKSKIVVSPIIDDGKFFPQTDTNKELFDIDIYKKIEMKPHGNYVDQEDNENKNSATNSGNICNVKKSQILYTVKDSFESILPELKRRMRLKPNQKLAILKQYKKNMLTKIDSKAKTESQSALDSKIVMFDYIPIVNEHEINIEFFKKIICYPKYRTNYDLIIIKRDDSIPSMNHQIRCYLDKEVYFEKINEYKSIKENLYGYYIMKDINTALTGTMMSNYNGNISFQSYMKFNQHRKFMSQSEYEEEERANSIDHEKSSLSGKFKTFPTGVEYFEREDKSKEEDKKLKFMCYDLWVLDFN